MIKNFLTLLFTFYFLTSFSQKDSENIGRLALTTIVPDQIEGISAIAKNNLMNKLNRITSSNGLGSYSFNSRFILTANIVVVSKDITTTAPPMHAYNLEVSFFIGDGIDGKLFASTAINLKGVGETETKAYNSALKNLRTNDKRLSQFIDEGKKKIIQYYNTQCDIIINNAMTLASQNEFDASIFMLMAIPDASKECYDKAMQESINVFTKKINRNCEIKLQDAQGIWSSGQNRESAEKAVSILSEIDPNADCFDEVKNLNEEIAKKMSQIDQREWNYMLKDQKQKSEIIEAIRAVGVAYGENQPQNITYNYRGWF